MITIVRSSGSGLLGRPEPHTGSQQFIKSTNQGSRGPQQIEWAAVSLYRGCVTTSQSFSYHGIYCPMILTCYSSIIIFIGHNILMSSIHEASMLYIHTFSNLDFTNCWYFPMDKACCTANNESKCCGVHSWVIWECYWHSDLLHNISIFPPIL